MAQRLIELSDRQWLRIQEFAQFQFPLQRGIPRADLTKVWNSILHILVHGCRWCDLPKAGQYTSKSTAHRWLLIWQKEGVFDRVLSGLLQDAVKDGRVDISHLIVDGTFSPSAKRWRGSAVWI